MTGTVNSHSLLTLMDNWTCGALCPTYHRLNQAYHRPLPPSPHIGADFMGLEPPQYFGHRTHAVDAPPLIIGPERNLVS